MADINFYGLGGVIVFYLLILVLGIWAGWKKSRRTVGEEGGESKEIMLAGRGIGLFVGAFTMTATWVGGGYINGTAEAVYSDGIVWAQTAWGYSLSLCFGGFLFAKIMRERKYVTMLDPFQERYGTRVGGLMYIPAFLGELIWSAATLNSLGAMIKTVLKMKERAYSVIVSACIAVSYTFLGGLWSVAYTDVVQLICMFFGMWIAIPFALTNEAVTPISQTTAKWTVGKGWQWPKVGMWIDNAMLLIFGGIPWQVYFQRVLSSKSHKRAQYLSFAASIGCLIMSIPSILIGTIGSSTNWNNTAYADLSEKKNGSIIINPAETMPLVLQYLTPTWVSFIGLGAVSAAVMSSVDSSVLSASSMFAHNIYKTILRQRATEREVIWVIRVGIVIVGTLSTMIGLMVESINGLAFLCSDVIFVVLFPELLCVLYFGYANTYGALFGYVVGFSLRLCSGEPLINFPAAIKYPWYHVKKEGGIEQRFPFRIFLMILTLFCIVIGSFIARAVFKHGRIDRKYDVAGDFPGEIPDFEMKNVIVTKGVEIRSEYSKVRIDGAQGYEMSEHSKKV